MSEKTLTHTEALGLAMDTLHEIGGALTSRQLLKRTGMNAILRSKLEEESKTDDEIIRLALDTWERIVMSVEPKLSGTMIFKCSPEDGEGRQE